MRMMRKKNQQENKKGKRETVKKVIQVKKTKLK